MPDVSDLRFTVVPKSDQLNSEQLLSGPMTVTVTGVSIGGDDQPLVVHYEGENGRPYKPCKTMRKVMLFAWGEDGRTWAGHSMTLYNDPTVKFGGAEVGGIRISHMTGIERAVKLSLTATKGKKALHTIEPLRIERKRVDIDDLADVIKNAPTIEQCKSAFETAYRSTKDAALRDRFKATYDGRMAALKQAQQHPATFDADAFAAKLQACTDVAVLDLAADEIRDVTDNDMRATLTDVYQRRRDELTSAAMASSGDDKAARGRRSS